MLLQNKKVVVYGAGGAVGSAVAHGFAREGARVFLTARNLDVIGTVAKEISAVGGAAETAVVDAGDEKSVTEHLDAVVADAGGIDVSFNAIGISPVGLQGIPLTELPAESFLRPITTYAQAHFITARAAARHMIARRSGVIMMHTPEPARSPQPLVGGMSHRKRPTTLAELTEAAVFLASDRASAMTGTVADLTGGIIVD